MASAKRLIELRHDWRSSRRMAEIRVPACPIPIHHTKLTMAKPQPIGIVTPQMPVPRTNKYPMAYSIIIVSRNITPNPINHPVEVGRVSTIELILSVTVAKVYPGSITGATSLPPATCSVRSSILDCLRSACQLGVGVANLSQVRGPGPCVQVREQAVVARLRLQFRNPAIGIINAAEDDCVGRTGLLASRLQLAVLNLPVFALGIDPVLVDALHAIRAFLHDAPAAHAHVGIAHHFVLRRAPVLEQQEVEAP